MDSEGNLLKNNANKSFICSKCVWVGGRRRVRMGTVFPLFGWVVYLEALVCIDLTQGGGTSMFSAPCRFAGAALKQWSWFHKQKKKREENLQCCLPHSEITIPGINSFSSKIKQRAKSWENLGKTDLSMKSLLCFQKEISQFTYQVQLIFTTQIFKELQRDNTASSGWCQNFNIQTECPKMWVFSVSIFFKITHKSWAPFIDLQPAVWNDSYSAPPLKVEPKTNRSAAIIHWNESNCPIFTLQFSLHSCIQYLTSCEWWAAEDDGEQFEAAGRNHPSTIKKNKQNVRLKY